MILILDKQLLQTWWNTRLHTALIELQALRLIVAMSNLETQALDLQCLIVAWPNPETQTLESTMLDF